VWIERDVGHYAELGKALLERRDGARHEPLGIERLASVGGLQLLLDRRKQRQNRNLQFQTLFRDRQQLVDGESLDTGHRGHFLGTGFAVNDEHRIDQVIGAERVLAHEAT